MRRCRVKFLSPNMVSYAGQPSGATYKAGEDGLLMEVSPMHVEGVREADIPEMLAFPSFFRVIDPLVAKKAPPAPPVKAPPAPKSVPGGSGVGGPVPSADASEPSGTSEEEEKGPKPAATFPPPNNRKAWIKFAEENEIVLDSAELAKDYPLSELRAVIEARFEEKSRA